jgi:6-pyruvoyltetrahydropterin/6-carboxytetrahydropterin synthase
MISVTRLYRFSASHRLHLESLSEEDNDRLYGKCNNPYGHGHDYVLEVTCAGAVDEASGLVVPIAQLDRLVHEKVLRLVASRNINLDVPHFAALVPTTENLATVIVSELLRSWSEFIQSGAKLTRVHVQETDRNGFEVMLAPEKRMEITANA